MRLAIHYKTADNQIVAVELVNESEYEFRLKLGSSSEYASVLASPNAITDTSGNLISLDTFLKNYTSFLYVRDGTIRQRPDTTLDNRIILEYDNTVPLAFGRANTVQSFGRL